MMKTKGISLWPWFQESGGMMTLTDIYCRVNRARGLEVNCFFPFSILARTGAGMNGSSVYSRTDRLIDFWCLTLKSTVKVISGWNREFIRSQTNLIHCSWHITLCGRGEGKMKLNELGRQKGRNPGSRQSMLYSDLLQAQKVIIW